MIELDFGILVAINASINTMPKTQEEFLIRPSKATKLLLSRHQSVFRFRAGKGHVLASDLLATFDVTQNGAREVKELNEIRKKATLIFSICSANYAVRSLIDSFFKPQELPALQGLSPAFKPVYVIPLEENSPEDITINDSQLMGLTPPILNVEKSKISTIHRKSDGQLLQPIIEEDTRLQYNFRNAKEGIYKITFTDSTTTEIYSNIDWYAKPPLGIVEITLKPATTPNSFVIKEYQLKFKKKP